MPTLEETYPALADSITNLRFQEEQEKGDQFNEEDFAKRFERILWKGVHLAHKADTDEGMNPGESMNAINTRLGIGPAHPTWDKIQQKWGEVGAALGAPLARASNAFQGYVQPKVENYIKGSLEDIRARAAKEKAAQAANPVAYGPLSKQGSPDQLSSALVNSASAMQGGAFGFGGQPSEMADRGFVTEAEMAGFNRLHPQGEGIVDALQSPTFWANMAPQVATAIAPGAALTRGAQAAGLGRAAIPVAGGLESMLYSAETPEQRGIQTAAGVALPLALSGVGKVAGKVAGRVARSLSPEIPTPGNIFPEEAAASSIFEAPMRPGEGFGEALPELPLEFQGGMGFKPRIARGAMPAQPEIPRGFKPAPLPREAKAPSYGEVQYTPPEQAALPSRFPEPPPHQFTEAPSRVVERGPQDLFPATKQDPRTTSYLRAAGRPMTPKQLNSFIQKNLEGINALPEADQQLIAQEIKHGHVQESLTRMLDRPVEGPAGIRQGQQLIQERAAQKRLPGAEASGDPELFQKTQNVPLSDLEAKASEFDLAHGREAMQERALMGPEVTDESKRLFDDMIRAAGGTVEEAPSLASGAVQTAVKAKGAKTAKTPMERALAQVKASVDKFEKPLESEAVSSSPIGRFLKEQKGELDVGKAGNTARKAADAVVSFIKGDKRNLKLLARGKLEGGRSLAALDAQEVLMRTDLPDQLRKELSEQMLEAKRTEALRTFKDTMKTHFPELDSKEVAELSREYDEVLPSWKRIVELAKTGHSDDAAINAALKTAKAGVTGFKKLATVYNPGLDAPNIVGDMIFGAQAGANWKWIGANKGEIWDAMTNTKNPAFRELVSRSVLGNEMFDASFQTARKDLDRILSGAKDPAELMRKLHAIDAALGRRLNIPDQFLKTALAMQSTDLGIRNGWNLKREVFRTADNLPDWDRAAIHVQKFTPGYRLIHPKIRKFTGSVGSALFTHPLARFPAEALRISKNVALERPVYGLASLPLYGTAAAGAWGLAAGGSSLAFGTDAPSIGEMKKAYSRTYSNPNNKGKLLLPKPYKVNGNVEFFDLTWMIPNGDLFKNVYNEGPAKGTLKSFASSGLLNREQMETAETRTAGPVERAAMNYIPPYRKLKIAAAHPFQRKVTEREGVGRDIGQIFGFPTVESDITQVLQGSKATGANAAKIKKDLTDVLNPTMTPNLTPGERRRRAARLIRQLKEAEKERAP